jgi:hypothetical protein
MSLLINLKIETEYKNGTQKSKRQLQLQLRVRDHPRDHPGKYLYYAGAGTLWLYLQSHCRLRNVTLVCV